MTWSPFALFWAIQVMPDPSSQYPDHGDGIVRYCAVIVEAVSGIAIEIGAWLGLDR